MEIKISKASPLETKTACLVIGVYEKSFSTPLLKELDRKVSDRNLLFVVCAVIVRFSPLQQPTPPKLAVSPFFPMPQTA